MSALGGQEGGWDAVGHRAGVSWIVAALVIGTELALLWWLA